MRRVVLDRSLMTLYARSIPLSERMELSAEADPLMTQIVERATEIERLIDKEAAREFLDSIATRCGVEARRFR